MRKPITARQDINMQLERLTIILDDMYKISSNNLGERHKITQRALKSMLYLHALKCDLSNSEVK